MQEENITTVAWDGRYVAADSQITYGDRTRGLSPCQKIKVIDGVVYALSGSAALFQPMIDWYLAGHDPKEVPTDRPDAGSDLIVFKGGRCTLFCTSMPYPLEFKAPEAFGSGSSIAQVAMSMGADARRAVEEAIKFDTCSGGDIQIVDLQAKAAKLKLSA